MLTILTINVQAAAPARAQRLLTWLLARDDDVIILTETSNGPGTRHLLTELDAAGLTVTHQPSPDSDRGCAIATRVPSRPAPHLTAGISLPGRAPAVLLDTDPAVTVLGLYVPSSDRAPTKVAKKRAFLTTVQDTLATMSAADRAHLVVGGDYNVISRDHQPRYSGFLAFEYEFLDTLNDLGLADIHQRLHPGAQAHSWIGRGGNRYRFDYLHAGPGLQPHLAAAYLHQPRLDGLTDHAAHTVNIDVGVHVRCEVVSATQPLF